VARELRRGQGVHRSARPREGHADGSGGGARDRDGPGGEVQRQPAPDRRHAARDAGRGGREQRRPVDFGDCGEATRPRGGHQGPDRDAAVAAGSGGRTASSPETIIRPVAAALAAAAVAVYAGIAVWYAGTLNYFDPAEPTVTAVAFAFGAGQPLYPALDAAERYVHVWGPALFITHAAALGIFGASVLASKAVGAVAAILSLGLGFLVFRQRAGSHAALIASGLCALVYLGFSNVTFWTRADPLLLAASVLGLAGATRRGGTAAVLCTAVALGVAVNLKVTGVLYVAPALALLYTNHGPRPVVASMGFAALLGAAPFLVSGISFGNYLDYLQLSARDGVVWQKVRQNLIWSAFLSAPLALVWWSARRAPQGRGVGVSVAAVLVVSIGIVAFAGAKAGGGPFHLLPFAPTLAFVTLAMWSSIGRPSLTPWLAVFAAAALAIAVPSQMTFVRTVSDRELGRVIDDLRRIADGEPGRRLAVGFAGTSYVSYARPEIVFRTRDYWLDAPAVQEHRRAGLPLPAATIRNSSQHTQIQRPIKSSVKNVG
jgi:hypothetical protein